jgi:hypothetical protein
MLLLYAADTVRALAQRFSRPRLVTGLAAGALALAVLPGTLGQLRLGLECQREFSGGNRYPCMPPMWHDLMAQAEMTRGRLPDQSVVISRKPTLYYAISGYRSRVYPLSADPDTFLAFAAESGARWVVVDQVPDLAPIYLHPMLMDRREDFCVVPELTLSEAVLLRIDTALPPPPQNRAPGLTTFSGCPLAGPEAR